MKHRLAATGAVCAEWAMPITDLTIERFREMMKKKHGVEMAPAEAKGRYLELLNLFWLLAHKPPQEEESPYEPPPPPWL